MTQKGIKCIFPSDNKQTMPARILLLILWCQVSDGTKRLNPRIQEISSFFDNPLQPIPVVHKNRGHQRMRFGTGYPGIHWDAESRQMGTTGR